MRSSFIGNVSSGGLNDVWYGGGIYLEDGSIGGTSSRIENSSFQGNLSSYGGGIASDDYIDVAVTSTFFENNSATRGGAVWARGLGILGQQRHGYLPHRDVERLHHVQLDARELRRHRQPDHQCPVGPELPADRGQRLDR